MRKTINQLSDAAIPIDDDDWGSDRQVSAENALAKFVIDNVGIDWFETQLSTIEGSKLSVEEGIELIRSQFVKHYKGK